MAPFFRLKSDKKFGQEPIAYETLVFHEFSVTGNRRISLETEFLKFLFLCSF